MIFLGITLLSVALSASERNFITVDGRYTICPFRQFRECDLLTEQMTQSDRFSADEKRTLRTLKTFTDAARTVTLIDFQKSFGRPTNTLELPGPANEHGAAWLTEPKGECPLCGIQATFSKGALSSVHYVVADRFMIVWYLGGETKPSR